jgi:hypothetical protein
VRCTPNISQHEVCEARVETETQTEMETHRASPIRRQRRKPVRRLEVRQVERLRQDPLNLGPGSLVHRASGQGAEELLGAAGGQHLAVYHGWAGCQLGYPGLKALAPGLVAHVSAGRGGSGAVDQREAGTERGCKHRGRMGDGEIDSVLPWVISRFPRYSAAGLLTHPSNSMTEWPNSGLHLSVTVRHLRPVTSSVLSYESELRVLDARAIMCISCVS